MQRSSIPAPGQLRLQVGTEGIEPAWEELPEATRVAALALLAGLIQRQLATRGSDDD